MRPAVLALSMLAIAGQSFSTTLPPGEDYYPAESRRLKEEGVTTIQVCGDARWQAGTGLRQVQRQLEIAIAA
jgi:hypothetical protein